MYVTHHTKTCHCENWLRDRHHRRFSGPFCGRLSAGSRICHSFCCCCCPIPFVSTAQSNRNLGKFTVFRVYYFSWFAQVSLCQYLIIRVCFHCRVPFVLNVYCFILWIHLHAGSRAKSKRKDTHENPLLYQFWNKQNQVLSRHSRHRVFMFIVFIIKMRILQVICMQHEPIQAEIQTNKICSHLLCK